MYPFMVSVFCALLRKICLLEYNETLLHFSLELMFVCDVR